MTFLFENIEDSLSPLQNIDRNLSFSFEGSRTLMSNVIFELSN